MPTNLRQRLRGTDTEIRIIANSVLEDRITKVTNFSFEAKLEVKSQGFLGAHTDEHDDVYSGCSFSFELQLDGPEWFALQQKILKRVKRITPDAQFSIVSTLYFPDGTTKLVVIPNAKFSGQPLDVGGRTEYAKVKCAGEADDFDLQDG